MGNKSYGHHSYNEHGTSKLEVKGENFQSFWNIWARAWKTTQVDSCLEAKQILVSAGLTYESKTIKLSEGHIQIYVHELVIS